MIFVDDLEVWVIVKPRLKNMNLRVQPDGRIEVSVRPDVSVREVEKLVREKRAWILQSQERYAGTPMARAASATPAEVREWRAVVEAFVPVLVEQWEPILGVKAGALAYRKMKSRWGSCQPSTGRICINVVLALYPPECLEYVVVHELAHLVVPGHGSEFHKLMDAVMPDWRERKAKLNG